MKKMLYIKADCNDADYLYSFNEINDSVIPLLDRVLSAIKPCKKSHNWPSSEYADSTPEELYEGKLTLEEIEEFQGYLPYGEDGMGIHTIEEIKIFEIASETKLL